MANTPQNNPVTKQEVIQYKVNAMQVKNTTINGWLLELKE